MNGDGLSGIETTDAESLVSDEARRLSEQSGPTESERLRHELLRTQWELREMRDRRDEQLDNARRWRNSFENAMHYLAVLNPNLAELAEDDHFVIWQASVR